MVYVLFGLIFLLGAALGSFVVVVSDRYQTGLPFWGGRSICFSCNSQLKSADLVPIFSFLFLRGRCRYCQSKIPAGAFIAEVVMGFFSLLAAKEAGLFAIFQSSIFSSFQTILVFLVLDLIFATVLLISIYDLKHFIIPDSFLVVFFVFSLIYNLYFVPHNSFLFLATNILSGLALALPFFLLFLISRGAWFGFGDVKYILVLGFLLGLSQGLSAVVLAFWVGAAFSLFAMLFKKIASKLGLPNFKNNLTMKSEIPFGPFLSLGIIISFYLSADLFQLHELFF